MNKPLIGITGRKDQSARLVSVPMVSVGESYVRAIHKVGGTPVILPPVMQPEDWATLLRRLDGILFSGGEDISPEHYNESPTEWMGGVDIERDASELKLVPLALQQNIPILGICRGHQVLNVALEGTLFQDMPSQIPGVGDHAYMPARPLETLIHPVTITAESKLAKILGHTTFEVNSAHHQSVHKAGRGLVVVAHSPDGIIEATEMPGHHFCVSVQWHPEAMVKITETMWPLFKAFVDAAAKHTS